LGRWFSILVWIQFWKNRKLWKKAFGNDEKYENESREDLSKVKFRMPKKEYRAGEWRNDEEVPLLKEDIVYSKK
jgi:hypothetical protein